MQPPGNSDQVGLGPASPVLDPPLPPRPSRYLGPLRLFGEVRASELPGVFLLAANGFVLLTAYYILKTIREPLILQGGGLRGIQGEELKTYATAVQALLLIGVVPLYSHVASRVNRRSLIHGTVALLILSLLVFSVLGHFRVTIGIPYYLWLGMASVVAIAQFWSFANDYYTRAEGERLFPLIAAGGGLGAILGAGIARWLLDRVALLQLMLVAVGLLVLYGALFSVVERQATPARKDATQADAPVAGQGGFTLIRKSPYLLLIAVTVLLATLVNTQGEYIFAGAVNDRAAELVPMPPPATPSGVSDAQLQGVLKARRTEVGKIYAQFYGTVNLLAVFIQLFVVSRLFKHLRVARTLYVFPVIALLAYGSIALLPAFFLIVSAKTLENGADYSLHNTVRHALFLPTSRDVKYKAKTAIDSFFLRSGDLLAAGTIFAGIHLLSLSGRAFAITNVVLVLLWLPVITLLARHYRQLA